MLALLKNALNISANNTAKDLTLSMLMNSAAKELICAGVAASKLADVNNLSDELLQDAIITYCRIQFTPDNAEAERLTRAFELIKARLVSSVEYTTEAV